MIISIIGTAGRGKQPHLNKQLWLKMLDDAISRLGAFPTTDNIQVQSGGAAWADHLAVATTELLDLPLTLHLPAPFLGAEKGFVDNGFKSPGSTANYYHRLFQGSTGCNSFQDIENAFFFRNASATVSNGFHARNLLVGDCDLLIAYTFGTHSGIWNKKVDSQEGGLADGGTAHTWNHSRATRRIHVNLAGL